MRVRFWGTRGSLPVALTAAAVRAKIIAALTRAAGRGLATPEAIARFVDEELEFSVRGTFGGHSPCVEIEAGPDDYLLCDLGTGARPFAAQALRRREGRPATWHVLLSHLHWDHIMGFPFFAPAWRASEEVRIYGCHPGLEDAFRRQQEPPSFPVPLAAMPAQLRFVQLQPGVTQTIAGCAVTTRLQQHGGDSYGYRIERGGRSLVYTTDSEHKLDDFAQTEAFAGFLRDADLVIFDAMYSLADAVSVKADWGHSSNVIGVELCQLARAKRLCLFHHEPMFDDATLQSMLEETRRFEEITRDGHAVEILSAHDGLELEL